MQADIDPRQDPVGFLNQNKKGIEQLSSQIVEGDYKPVRNIYADLLTIKDLRMGLLIALCKSRYQINYLLSRLKYWNIRPQRGYKLVYPQLVQSEEELSDMFIDRKYHKSMFNNAPDTTFSTDIDMLLRQVQTLNSRCDYRDKPNFYLNIWPLDKSDISTFLKMFEDYISPISFKLEVIDMSPSLLPAQLIKTTDVYVLDDFAAQCKVTRPMFEPLFEKHEFTFKTIYAAPQVEDEIKTVWEKEDKVDIWNMEQQHAKFQTTSVFLNLLTNFEYCYFPIPHPDGSDPFPEGMTKQRRVAPELKGNVRQRAAQ